MEKRIEYSNAVCEVVSFEATDVIASSVPTGSSGGNMDNSWDT